MNTEKSRGCAQSCENTVNVQGACIGQIKQDRDPTIQVIANVRANRSFEDALAHCKYGGKKIARAGWNGKDMWVAAQHPDKNSKMSEPYLYIRNAQGGLVPWLISQGDVFANDWAILPD